MKKIAPFLILFLFALLVWKVFTYSSDMTVSFDGDEIGGPLGALLAVLCAGGGTIIAGLAMLVAGGMLALVFAGLGIVLLGGLAIGALAFAAAIAPLLLPLLLPMGVIWYLVSRSRKNRMVREQAV
jgi:hypothetical protein